MNASKSRASGGGFDGRIIVITGSGSGLGMHYARHLASLGAHIAVVDRDAEGAQEVTEAIKGDGLAAKAFDVDVADEESVRSGFSAIRDTLGTPEVLINNAGILGGLMPVEEFSLERWNTVLGVNLTGTWLCSREVIPAMKKAGWGRIVNISSATFSMGSPENMVPYIASKGGVVGLTRAMARELGKCGITVNGVAPGFTPQPKRNAAATPSAMTQQDIQDIRDGVVAGQAMKRNFAPADLLGAVEYLASEAAGMTTGQVFNIDGGWAFT